MTTVSEAATKSIADKVASNLSADVFFLTGEITRAKAEKLERALKKRFKRENVLLVLVTQGGDPDAAFRIGRAFQNCYKKVSTLIPGWCKSAGTLITLAGSTIYLGDLAELGPLDIQLAKQDELDEAASGLLIDATMRTLESTTSRMFINFLKSIRKDTGVTTKMAAELSAKMAVGLMGPIFSQIEPMKVGENARAMNITRLYGIRLVAISKGLADMSSLDFLVNSYPDHGFVIDRREAALIYKDVQEPDPAMEEFIESLGSKALYPPRGRDSGQVEYLSTEAKSAKLASSKKGVAQSVQSPKKAGKGAGRRSASPSRDSGARVARTADRANGHKAPPRRLQ
jgi:hypothetical protein